MIQTITNRDLSQAQLIVAATAVAFNIPVVDVFHQQRLVSNQMMLRQIAMYMLSTVFDHNLTHVGRVFNRDRGTVRQACQYIEDQRDHPAFDERLQALEIFLKSAPQPLQTRGS